MDVSLREAADSDIDIFYEQQRDTEANWMAAFVSRNPEDRAAFDAHWKKIRSDENVALRTILAGGDVAGYVSSFLWDARREVCYWIGREFWAKGVATTAVRLFLSEYPVRPLYAAAACDNEASLRVLEKCGFRECGRGRGFAGARGEEIEEIHLVLE